MNKKLIFRILGAVSSALIIVSIFIPFISVSGYSQSLWDAYSKTNALYLPIMIIVFGSIGVLFFSLNIKTEIAYSTAGALLFYLISETISFIDQDMIKTLSVGYYCLVIGTILTGIMAFLCNLRSKSKVVNSVSQQEKPASIITQIDALYNNPVENMSVQSQVVDQGLNMPMPVQPIQPIPTMPVQPVSPVPEIPVQPQPMEPIPEVQVQSQSVESVPEIPTPQPSPVPSALENPMNSMNSNINSGLNPVVAEFSSPMPAVPTMEPQIPIQQQENLSQSSNPVTSEFNTVSNTVLPDTSVKEEIKVDNASTNNLDIFN